MASQISLLLAVDPSWEIFHHCHPLPPLFHSFCERHFTPSFPSFLKINLGPPAVFSQWKSGPRKEASLGVFPRSVLAGAAGSGLDAHLRLWGWVNFWREEPRCLRPLGEGVGGGGGTRWDRLRQFLKGALLPRCPPCHLLLALTWEPGKSRPPGETGSEKLQLPTCSSSIF